MPNIVIPNTFINSANEKFHGIWKLTRGMLAAGWRYKASANSFVMESAGDTSKDLWSVGGFINTTQLGAQTGTAATISTPIVATGTTPPLISLTGAPAGAYDIVIQIVVGGARGVATFRWSLDGGNSWTGPTTTTTANALSGSGLTVYWPANTYTNDNVWTLTNSTLTVSGLTGMSASSVGRALTISGATTVANNGTFRIASYISATSVTVYNPGAAGLSAFQNEGSSASINTVVAGTVTLAGMAGMTPSSVGHYITISGAASAANNGMFLITSYIGATTVTYYNASAVASDANNPNIHWVESPFGTVDPYADQSSGSITWSERVGGTAGLISSIATNKVVTVSGLSGMTPSSVGHRLTILGAANSGNNGGFLIVEYISSSQVKILNPAASLPDAFNGALNWLERDPAQDMYPTALNAGSWLVLQGPSTLKIPIGTTVPSPAFIRGEKITQAATGTEGEVLGVVTDSVGGGGFMVVAPRVNGTGGGPRGWDTSIITAVSAPTGSGASVTPSATVIEFVREMVFWKYTGVTGHIYYQCIDQASEATPTALTGRFSTMAAGSIGGSITSVPTPNMCPGGNTGTPLNNGFPVAGTLAVAGTGGAGAYSLLYTDLSKMLQAVNGMMQVICVNNIEAAGVSQDGSFTLLMGQTQASTTAFTLNGFMRLDDTEDGDVDPYVAYWPTGLASYLRNRTGNASDHNGSDYATTLAAYGATISWSLGFRRRGFATGDGFQEFGGWCLNISTNAQFAMGINSYNPETVACTFSSVPLRVREPIWVASSQYGSKMRKGTMRWWYLIPGGNATNTYDGKKWAQFSSQSSTAICALAIGPWDGITNPQQY